MTQDHKMLDDSQLDQALKELGDVPFPQDLYRRVVDIPNQVSHGFWHKLWPAWTGAAFAMACSAYLGLIVGVHQFDFEQSVEEIDITSMMMGPPQAQSWYLEDM